MKELDVIGDNIRIVLPELSDQKIIEDLAELYCKIWEEPPWNEFFWKKEEVIEEIVSLLGRKDALIIIAIKEEEVCGFSWGYLVDIKKMRNISGNKKLDFLFNNINLIFYLSSLGTINSFRGKGLGSIITEIFFSYARKRGFSNFCLRTDIKAEAARRVYEKFGFKELRVHDKNHPNRTYWFLE